MLLLTGSYGFGAALVIAADSKERLWHYDASACETQSRACMESHCPEDTSDAVTAGPTIRGAIINAETPRRPNTLLITRLMPASRNSYVGVNHCS
jgi:hypothetical protein